MVCETMATLKVFVVSCYTVRYMHVDEFSIVQVSLAQRVSPIPHDTFLNIFCSLGLNVLGVRTLHMSSSLVVPEGVCYVCVCVCLFVNERERQKESKFYIPCTGIFVCMCPFLLSFLPCICFFLAHFALTICVNQF